jgi:hypothetical protein
MPFTCETAIAEAKARAASTGHPQTVWRCNERFAVTAECTGFPEAITMLNPGPVRPVATYDPDGTENS